MKKKLKQLVQIIILFTFLGYCIFFPKQSINAASRGLLQWYQKILPVLFPFMIVTSLIQILHYDQLLSKKCHLLMFPFRHYSKESYYIILLGLLCGFPMGAKLVCQSYKNKQLSKKEATYLLSFCNNLSPAFMFGVVFPILKSMNKNDLFLSNTKIPYIFLMYGIPLLYGFFMQFFLSAKDKIAPQSSTDIPKKLSLPEALDHSLSINIVPIVKLGCYIMLFQILGSMLTTFLIKQHFYSKTLIATIYAGIEIVGGTNVFEKYQLHGILHSALLLFLLHFGGVSCIMQTSIFTSETDLKLATYIRHKLTIGFISAISFLCISIIV